MKKINKYMILSFIFNIITLISLIIQGRIIKNIIKNNIKLDNTNLNFNNLTKILNGTFMDQMKADAKKAFFIIVIFIIIELIIFFIITSILEKKLKENNFKLLSIFYTLFKIFIAISTTIFILLIAFYGIKSLYIYYKDDVVISNEVKNVLKSSNLIDLLNSEKRIPAIILSAKENSPLGNQLIIAYNKLSSFTNIFYSISYIFTGIGLLINVFNFYKNKKQTNKDN